MDGGNIPQTSVRWDVGVPTHWGGTGNGGTGGDRIIYRLPPEHGHAIRCNLSYHGLMSGGGVESGTAPILVCLSVLCMLFKNPASQKMSTVDC